MLPQQQSPLCLPLSLQIHYHQHQHDDTLILRCNSDLYASLLSFTEQRRPSQPPHTPCSNCNGLLCIFNVAKDITLLSPWPEKHCILIPYLPADLDTTHITTTSMSNSSLSISSRSPKPLLHSFSSSLSDPYPPCSHDEASFSLDLSKDHEYCQPSWLQPQQVLTSRRSPQDVCLITELASWFIVAVRVGWCAKGLWQLRKEREKKWGVLQFIFCRVYF